MTNPKATVHKLQAPPKPTPEQIKEQQIRAMLQQRNSMAQIFAANICSNTPFDVLKEHGAKEVAKFSADLADEMMEQFYGADA